MTVTAPVEALQVAVPCSKSLARPPGASCSFTIGSPSADAGPPKLLVASQDPAMHLSHSGGRRKLQHRTTRLLSRIPAVGSHLLR